VGAAAARREGSSCGAVAINGLQWERVRSGFKVHLPGGAAAERVSQLKQSTPELVWELRGA
jgi:hypothetical protein